MARQPGFYAIDAQVGTWDGKKQIFSGGTRGPSMKRGPGSRSVARAQKAAGLRAGRAAARGGKVMTATRGAMSMKGVKGAHASSSAEFKEGFARGKIKRNGRGEFA